MPGSGPSTICGCSCVPERARRRHISGFHRTAAAWKVASASSARWVKVSTPRCYRWAARPNSVPAWSVQDPLVPGHLAVIRVRLDARWVGEEPTQPAASPPEWAPLHSFRRQARVRGTGFGRRGLATRSSRSRCIARIISIVISGCMTSPSCLPAYRV